MESAFLLPDLLSPLYPWMRRHFTLPSATTVSLKELSDYICNFNCCELSTAFNFILLFWIIHTSIFPAVYIFPGLGLGATLCGAERVSDKMLYVAAEALANFVTDEDLEVGKVFPPLNQIRDVSRRVAVAVIRQAMEEGQATKLRGKDIEDLELFVEKKMYDPVYVPLVEKREISI